MICYPLQEGFKKIFIFFVLAGVSPDYSITVFLQSRLLGCAVDFKEDFRRMAKESIFLEEAYETLQRLSADDIKRLEYEAREKALRDHNSFVGSARRQGEKIGEKRGEKRGEKNGIELAKKVFKLQAQGKTEEEIASECRMDVEKVREILE
jgi:hypothetical protein